MGSIVKLTRHTATVCRVFFTSERRKCRGAEPTFNPNAHIAASLWRKVGRPPLWGRILTLAGLNLTMRQPATVSAWSSAVRIVSTSAAVSTSGGDRMTFGPEIRTIAPAL